MSPHEQPSACPSCPGNRRSIVCSRSHDQQPGRQHGLKPSRAGRSDERCTDHKPRRCLSSPCPLYTQQQFQDRHTDQYRRIAVGSLPCRLCRKQCLIILPDPLIEVNSQISAIPEKNCCNSQPCPHCPRTESPVNCTQQENCSHSPSIQPSSVKRQPEYRQKCIPPRNHKKTHGCCLKEKK